MRTKGLLLTAIAFIAAPMAFGQQRETPPTALPAPQVGAPRQQRPQSQSSITPVQGPLVTAPGPGTIMGYVYWDSNTIKHLPASSCGGLSVTVTAGSTSLGTFSANTFAYVPNIGTLGVCAYAIDHMPVGQNLEVQVSVTAPTAFSPAIVASGGDTINIMGGTQYNKCTNLPPAVPSPADLSGHWSTCASHAYNVNIILSPARGLVGANRTAVGQVPPGATQTPNPRTQGPLLAPGGQKTLLGPQGNSSTDGGRSNLPAVRQRIDGGKSGASATPQSAATDGELFPAVQRPLGQNPSNTKGTLGDGSRSSSAAGSSAGDGGKKADELSPQPYPPKGALLAPGSQNTIDGGKAGLRAAQRPTQTDGSLSEGARVGSGGTIGPGQGMSAPGNSPASTPLTPQSPAMAMTPGSKVHALPTNARTSACIDEIAKGQALTVISTVDGKAAPQVPWGAGSAPGFPIIGATFDGGVTFTPSKHYIIQGCGFGATTGQILIKNGASPSDPNYLHVRLNPQQWSGQRIDAEVDPSASGVAQGVYLVVLTAGTTERPQMGAGAGEATAFGYAFAPNGSPQADIVSLSKTSLGNVASTGNGTASLNKASPGNIVTTGNGPAVTQRTLQKAGPGQTISAGGNSPAPTPLTPQSPATLMPPASGSSPAVLGRASSDTPSSTLSGAYVAAACAKDPTFRILGVSGTPDGTTLTVGPQYTIWGCAFGAAGLLKAPTSANSPSQNRTLAQAGQAAVAIYSTPFKTAWFVYATIDSWSDNAISIQVTPSEALYRGQSVAGMDLTAMLWVTRADGQSALKGGIVFKPTAESQGGQPSAIGSQSPQANSLAVASGNMTPNGGTSTGRMLLSGGTPRTTTAGAPVEQQAPSSAIQRPQTNSLTSGAARASAIKENPNSGPSSSGGQIFDSGGGGGGGSGQLLDSGGGAPRVSNKDVLNLLKAGVPASAIIASIRSRPGDFDLSNKSRADLFAAGGKDHLREMTEIWDAMIAKATNGRGGNNAAELSPQPYPPKSASNASGDGGKSGAPAVPPSPSADRGLGPVVQRPAVGDGTLNGATRVSSGGTLGPGQNMSAQGDAPGSLLAQRSLPTIPPIHSNPQRDASRPVDATTRAEVKKKLAAQVVAVRQGVMHSTTPTSPQAEDKTREAQSLKQQKSFVDSWRNQSGSTQLRSNPTRAGTTEKTIGATLPAATAKGPALAPAVGAHRQPRAGPDPRFVEAGDSKVCLGTQIYSVNGVSGTTNATSPVVFTQDPPFNDYVITGCGFGNQEGGQAYLSGAVTGGRINMTVLQWTPTMIEAEVQPGLSGVLDGWPDLIVVPPGGGAPGKFPNCRFYAQRQSVLLPSIPRGYAHLANVQVGDSTHGGGTMYCPGPDLAHLFPCISFNAGPPLDGVTNEPADRGLASTPVSNAVDRDAGQMQFNSGEDVYDLSHLAPGFAIDNFFANWYAWSASICKGWAAEGDVKFGDSLDYSTEGHYQFYQKGSQIVVDWGVDNCALRFLGTKIFGNDEYNSGYSLTVYAKGPIGTDPWTGQPVKQVSH